MKYTKITIFTKEDDDTAQGGVELLTSKLTDLGAEGFEIGGGSELRRLIDSTDPDLIGDELIQQTSKDEPVTVTVYIHDNGQGRGIAKAIEDFLHSESLEYAVGEVAEQDWENNWKQYFKPIEVGNRLVVKPLWEDYDNPGGRIILEIDPSGAFGTGQHATTMLCLQVLTERIKAGNRVIDMGCGSGILAAAAMLLGAESVTAVDICENAVRVAEETFRLNGITDYTVHCGNVISDEGLRERIGGGYDIAVANITADVIIAMSGLLAGFTDSALILSGIIAPRLPEVLEAVTPDFDVLETRESGGWIGLVCSKK